MTLAGASQAQPPAEPGAGAPARAERPAGTLRAHAVRRTQARDRPGGRVVATLGTRTGFGSARVLYVAARRGGWLGVAIPQQPNGRLAWIPADATRLEAHQTEIVVDRSQRVLELRRGDDVAARMTVDVGRPGTETPLGTFAVTDRLRMPAGSPYGCCALALSGHQTKPLPGWPGGDRLAIHGIRGDGVDGSATSLGCLRARARDLRALMRTVPLGTPVTIRR